MRNTFKTALFLGLLTGLLLIIGDIMGGKDGVVVALIFAGIMNFFSYWFSDKLVMAMMRGQEVLPDELPYLHSMVEKLAQSAGIPKPRIYIVPSPSPNAFATGRNPSHSAVAVTEGILRLLSREELEGVLAHEIAHIKNRDTLISTISATIAGAIMFLAYMARWAVVFGGMGGRDNDRRSGALFYLLIGVLAPIAAMLIQFAISRAREFEADATGARIAGNPYGLASALRKLAEGVLRIPMQTSPATSHMFIVNPLSGGGIAKLFSTHPPIEERIRRLLEMRF